MMILSSAPVEEIISTVVAPFRQGEDSTLGVSTPGKPGKAPNSTSAARHGDSLHCFALIPRLLSGDNIIMSLHRVVALTGIFLSAGIMPMLLGGCSTASSRHAPPQKQPAGVRAGDEIFTSCLLCHSTREMQRGPIIDGLPAWSVELQLKKFRDKVRGGNPANKSEVLMAAGESILQDDGEIRRVAAHIASLPPQSHLLTVKGDKNRGKLIYLQCVKCHGVKGEGKEESKSPPLNTLEDWFQLDQLRKFKSGLRGKHPLDVEGNAMRLAVLGLSDDDFKNVTRYIAEDLAAAKPLSKQERK